MFASGNLIMTGVSSEAFLPHGTISTGCSVYIVTSPLTNEFSAECNKEMGEREIRKVASLETSTCGLLI